MSDLQPAELDRLLSIDEVSTYIDIPKNTLYRWRVDGKGPRGIRMGKHVRFRRSEVEAWLDRNSDERPAA